MENNKSCELDWQISRNTIKERGQYLMETGLWSDCKFLVGTGTKQEILEGHKLFLAMSSPVFEAMFYGNMAEKNEPIPILDVQPDAFKALLEYIYTDNININSFDKACELCYGAKKYMLPHLVEKCTKYLWADLHAKNAIRAYEFAKLFEEPVLMDKCMQIICTKTIEVLTANSFVDVDLSTMMTIFEQDNLEVCSELDLFDAATRYAQKNCSMDEEDEDNVVRLQRLHDVIKKIRFLTLTPQQFAEGPARSRLLTQPESFSILMNISSPLSDCAMPEGFSLSIQKRKSIQLPYPSSSTMEDREREMQRDTMSRSFCPIPSPALPMPNVLQAQSGTGGYGDRPGAREHLAKYICLRSIVHHNDCLNTSVLDCSVTFSVDKNICVTGVEVPTQSEILDHNISQPSAMPSTYTDVLYAHLLDADGSRLTYTHYTNRVSVRSLQEISFNRPVYIQRNKVYKVGVVFNKVGWYPMGNCSLRITCETVNFNFGVGQASDSVRDGLIRAIVFNF